MAALRIIALSALALLAACGTSSGARGGAVEAGELSLEALEPRELPVGVCGLYLWAQVANEPVFVLDAWSAPTQARVAPRGRERLLRRTEAEGEALYGHHERQVFSDGRLTLEVDVTFDTGRPMRDGAALQRGVIRVRDDAGWETIVPVGGLVACQA